MQQAYYTAAIHVALNWLPLTILNYGRFRRASITPTTRYQRKWVYNIHTINLNNQNPFEQNEETGWLNTGLV